MLRTSIQRIGRVFKQLIPNDVTSSRTLTNLSNSEDYIRRMFPKMKRKSNLGNSSQHEQVRVNIEPCPICTSQYGSTDGLSTPSNHASSSSTLSMPSLFFQEKGGGRPYLRCSSCDCTFVPRTILPDSAFEKERYQMHENNPADANYRKFLSKAVDPLIHNLSSWLEEVNSQSSTLTPQPPHHSTYTSSPFGRSGFVGLDFGCGPGPTISSMLHDVGIPHVVNYDPYFHPQPIIPPIAQSSGFRDASKLSEAQHPSVLPLSTPLDHCVFDFITCTEVIEHLADPVRELQYLRQLLRRPNNNKDPMSLTLTNGPLITSSYQSPLTSSLIPKDSTCSPSQSTHRLPSSSQGGLIVLMTGICEDDSKFPSWWYKFDPTHVTFFKRKTVDIMAQKAGLKVIDQPHETVFVLVHR